MNLLSVFKSFVDSQEWPAEIAHLKGVTLERKKDGNRYRIVRPEGEFFGGKPCAYLEPAGCAWDSRSHWKTYAKILSEMTVVKL